MIAKHDKPLYQPKWMLQAQVFLLRHHLGGPFTKQFMIITTIGRRTGRKYSVPISYVRDEGSYLALNLGGVSNWYKNLRADPLVTLEIDGQTMHVCAVDVPVKTFKELHYVLTAFEREQPGTFKATFGVSPDAPPDELMKIAERVKFVRFYPFLSSTRPTT